MLQAFQSLQSTLEALSQDISVQDWDLFWSSKCIFWLDQVNKGDKIKSIPDRLLCRWVTKIKLYRKRAHITMQQTALKKKTENTAPVCHLKDNTEKVNYDVHIMLMHLWTNLTLDDLLP